MDTNKVEVNIGGISYTIVADTNPETTKNIAKYIDGKLSDIKENNHKLNPNMINILTMMNITAELFEMEAMKDRLQEEAKDPKNRVQVLEEELKTLGLEKEELKSNLESLKDEVLSSLNVIGEMNKQKEELEAKYREASGLLDQRNSQLKTLNENLEKVQVDLVNIQKAYQDLSKKLSGDN